MKEKEFHNKMTCNLLAKLLNLQSLVMAALAELALLAVVVKNQLRRWFRIIHLADPLQEVFGLEQVGA